MLHKLNCLSCLLHFLSKNTRMECETTPWFTAMKHIKRKTLTVIVEPFLFTQWKHILSNNYGYENFTWREAPWLHARSVFCVWKVHISPGARVNSHRVVGKGNYYWCFLLLDESNKEEAAIINSLFHRCFSSTSNQAILLILPAGTFIPV